MLDASSIQSKDNAAYQCYENTALGLYQQQVELRADHVAVQIGPLSLTYKELDERSDELAQSLITLGVRKDTVVAILFPRSLEMIVGIFGILKAGGAYVPLGPKDGAERVDFILEDTKAPVLITQEKYLPEISGSSVLDVDLSREDWIRPINIAPLESQDSPLTYPVKIDPTAMAYIIYTSGTTGKPKGVMIEHRNLYAYLMNFRPTIEASDRTLQSMSTTCDSSVAEIFPTLCSGATLIFWEKDLSATIKNEKITYTNLTPSMAELVNPKDCSTLKKLIIGGEKLKTEIVKRFPETVEIYNGYGPTEATVDATVSKMTDPANIHIGTPLPHVKIYVVDKEGQICTDGKPGELWIGGEGVARGYLNRPDLTKEKFIKNPFDEGRVYKTGDLVCWKSIDHLDFLGRIDRQVKVRGFRVELDGLEKLISTYPGVTGAHVVLGGQNLVAYLTPKNLCLRELKDFIRKQVPSYAIPSTFVDMESFPINSAGKVDEKALPTPVLPATKKEDLPSTSEELKLAEIWRKILAPDMDEKEFPISIKDNFYDLGGNSLDVLKLTQRLQEEINPSYSLDQANANPGFEAMVGSLHEAQDFLPEEKRASKWRIFIDSVKSLPSYTCDIFNHYGPFIILIIALILFPILTLIMMALEFVFHRFFKIPHFSFFRKMLLALSAPAKKYKSVTIIEEYPLEKIKRTAFMLTPHGVTEHHIKPVEQHLIKKGVSYKNTHHALYFKVPFCKTWYQLNMGIPGKEESYYQAEKEDFSLMLALGDRETLRSDEAGFVDISGQKVFFKYILKSGTSLTPVYVHGNEKAFTPYSHFIKEKFNLYRKYNGLTFQPFWGRALSPFPHKVDLKVTFGKPIEVEKVENPTWDQVETLYAKYIESLKDLYRRHAPADYPELKVY